MGTRQGRHGKNSPPCYADCKDGASVQSTDNTQRDDERGCGEMSIEISQETEARLESEARRLGISVDELLKRLIDERAALTRQAQSIPSLPLWHLGGAGALHRREIYNDVR
jgi:hypothetical protein